MKTWKGANEVINYLLLELKIKEKGLTNEAVAKLLDIDPATLYRKKRGDTDFTRKELQVLRRELELTSDEVDSIFFNL